jgi:hypothetical protein
MLETESPPGRSAAGRIMSMKNSSDNIGYRTRDRPAYSTVLQPTAPPHNPSLNNQNLLYKTCIVTVQSVTFKKEVQYVRKVAVLLT